MTFSTSSTNLRFRIRFPMYARAARLRRLYQAGQFGPRERDILTAIVESYISTGEPVGSRTLSRQNKDGLSPATIRNVMADLVDGGFLEQPHTSAGRVPTTQAYRYYVDQISGKAVLSPADQTLISDTLHGTIDVQEFL